MIQIDEGLNEYKEPYVISPKRLGVISDIHMKFHHKGAVITALEYLNDKNIDTLLLNGDIIDNYKISRHSKVKPKVREYADEIYSVREFISNLSKCFPKKKIIYKMGNHEDRFDLKISEKLPELEGLVSLADLLKLRENNIEIVESKQSIKAGNLNIIHGHEVYGGGIHVAYNFLNKLKENVLFSNFHRPQEVFSKLGFSRKSIGAWATGCLCQLQPDYMAYNQWEHGFAFVEFDGNDFEVENKKIINNKVR